MFNNQFNSERERERERERAGSVFNFRLNLIEPLSQNDLYQPFQLLHLISVSYRHRTYLIFDLLMICCCP